MAGRPGHFWIDETCIGCGACEHACPGKVDAIHPVAGDFLGRFVVDLDDCIDCGFCVPLCPVACIHDARAEGGGDAARLESLQSWAVGRGSPAA